MKAIDSMWFNSLQGHFGFVIGENEMGARRLYSGVVSGLDQKADEQAILNWGNKVNIGIMEDLIARTKKEETYTCPKCEKISHNPEDRKHKYCGACHTSEPYCFGLIKTMSPTLPATLCGECSYYNKCVERASL